MNVGPALSYRWDNRFFLRTALVYERSFMPRSDWPSWGLGLDTSLGYRYPLGAKLGLDVAIGLYYGELDKTFADGSRFWWTVWTPSLSVGITFGRQGP